MPIMVFWLFVLNAMAVSESELLTQLQQKYAACDRVAVAGQDAIALKCKRDAYSKSELKKYCRKSISRCQASLNGNGFGFLDPKRCLLPQDCRLVQEDGLQAAILSASSDDAACKGERGPDKKGLRAELTDPLMSQDCEPVQYDFKMKVPDAGSLRNDNGDADKTNDNNMVLAQLHSDNGSSPPMALRLKNGKYVVTMRHDRGENNQISSVFEDGQDNGHKYEKALDLAPSGKYQDISLQTKPGPRGESFLRVLIDGKLVFDSEAEMKVDKKKCDTLSGKAKADCYLKLPYFGYTGKNYYFKFGPYDYTCTTSPRFAVHYANYTRGPVAPQEVQTVEVLDKSAPPVKIQ